MPPVSPSVAAFFAHHPQSLAIFKRIQEAVDAAGAATSRISKSQISFRRRRTFAAAWIPAQYLDGPQAPLVLTLYFPHRESSARWKEVVEPRPGHFTHHLELREPAEVDREVQRLVRAAWMSAA